MLDRVGSHPVVPGLRGWAAAMNVADALLAVGLGLIAVCGMANIGGLIAGSLCFKTWDDFLDSRIGHVLWGAQFLAGIAGAIVFLIWLPIAWAASGRGAPFL